jgi:NADPH-dependent F420 reductase
VAKSIALIGGTGPEGKGLAARFARAGLDVCIGSRAAERGREAADEVAKISAKKVRGATNQDALKGAEMVLLTVPYSGLRDTVRDLAAEIGERILISAVVPLEFSRTRIAGLHVPDGSAAQEAQLLAPRAKVVGAFQNLAAGHLLDLDHEVDGDVIICSDEIDALRETIELAELIPGVRGVNGGPLANSHYVEEITALLLNLNRLHKAETHVKIAGL